MTAISAQEATRTVLCSAPGCGLDAEFSDGLCFEHERLKVQAATAAHSSEWTRETVIAAVQEWATIHGRPPTSSQWQRRNEGYPRYTACIRLFPSGWRSLIEAAGFDYDALYAHRPAPRAAVDSVSPEPEPGPEPERAAKPPTLVELAQVVDNLSTRRRAMLAELDAVESELREAVGALQDALRPLALEAAA